MKSSRLRRVQRLLDGPGVNLKSRREETKILDKCNHSLSQDSWHRLLFLLKKNEKSGTSNMASEEQNQYENQITQTILTCYRLKRKKVYYPSAAPPLKYLA